MSNFILSHSNFIHIPKCGGSALNTAFWYLKSVTSRDQRIASPHHGHLFASQMPENGKPFFSFVRHPVNWWLSFYHWNKNINHSRFCAAEIATESFEEWIRDYGPFWLGHYSVLVKRYLGEDPLFPTNNKVLHIGKTENLFSDLKTIFEDVQQPYNAVVMNRLITGDLNLSAQQINKQCYARDVVSTESRNLIYNCEKYMYDTFNYKL